MALPRFYGVDIGDSSIELDGEQVDHARRVLRLRPGSEVEVFDGRGGAADATVQSIGRTMRVEITARRQLAPPRPRINLAVAVPKGDRAAMLVEKAAELGADRLIPIITKRSVVDPGRGKLERFERIALEATKQCGRAWLMQIDAPTPFTEIVRQCAAELRLIADVADAEGDVPAISPASASSITVLIGPEGGWTDDERRAAAEAGFTRWHFAPNILRIETAAIAAVAILRHGA